MSLLRPIFSEDGSHLYRFAFLAAQNVLLTAYKWRNAVETDPHGVDFTKALGELDVVVRRLGVALDPPVADGQFIDPWDRPNWRDIPFFLCWAVAPSIEQVDIKGELAQTRRGEMFSALGLSGPSVHEVVYKLGEATWNAFFRIPPNQDQPVIDALLGADSFLRTEIQGLGPISTAEKDLLDEQCRCEAESAWANAKARKSGPPASGDEESEAPPEPLNPTPAKGSPPKPPRADPAECVSLSDLAGELSPLLYRIMEYLWDEPSVHVDSLQGVAWKSPVQPGTVDQALKRLSTKLVSLDLGVTISTKNRFVTLDRPREQPTGEGEKQGTI